MGLSRSSSFSKWGGESFMVLWLGCEGREVRFTS